MKNLREILKNGGFEAEESKSSNKLWFFTKGNIRVSVTDETLYIKVAASISYKEVLNKLYNPFELEKALKDLKSADVID